MADVKDGSPADGEVGTTRTINGVGYKLLQRVDANTSGGDVRSYVASRIDNNTTVLLKTAAAAAGGGDAKADLPLAREHAIRKMLDAHPNLNKLLDVSIPAAPAASAAANAANTPITGAADAGPAQPPDALVLSVCTGRGGLACGSAGVHSAAAATGAAGVGSSDCFGMAEPDAVVLLRQVFTIVDHCHTHDIALRSIGWHSFKYVSDSSDSPIQLVDLSSAIVATDEQSVESPPTRSSAANPYDAPEVRSHSNDEKLAMTGREWRAAEMFSLGVMAYVCLTDSFPFEPTDTSMSDFVFRRKVSKNAELLIRSLLQSSQSRSSAKDALQSPFFTKPLTHAEYEALERERASAAGLMTPVDGRGVIIPAADWNATFLPIKQAMEAFAKTVGREHSLRPHDGRALALYVLHQSQALTRSIVLAATTSAAAAPKSGDDSGAGAGGASADASSFSLWSKYDRDGNGELDTKECTELLKDALTEAKQNVSGVLGATFQQVLSVTTTALGGVSVDASVKTAVNDKVRDAIDSSVQKATETIDAKLANTDELAERMCKALDLNGNGKVEKHELNTGFTAAFEATCGLHAMLLSGLVDMLGAVAKVLNAGTHPTGDDPHVHVFFGASRPARYRDVERLPILSIVSDAATAAAAEPETKADRKSVSSTSKGRASISAGTFAMSAFSTGDHSIDALRARLYVDSIPLLAQPGIRLVAADTTHPGIVYAAARTVLYKLTFSLPKSAAPDAEKVYAAPTLLLTEVVAGSATAAGYEDKRGADARFRSIESICIDGSSSVAVLYVVDGDTTQRIRRVSADGSVTTVAGSGRGGRWVEGCTALTADFDHLSCAIVVDHAAGIAGSSAVAAPADAAASDEKTPAATTGGADQVSLLVLDGLSIRRVTFSTVAAATTSAKADVKSVTLGDEKSPATAVPASGATLTAGTVKTLIAKLPNSVAASGGAGGAAGGGVRYTSLTVDPESGSIFVAGPRKCVMVDEKGNVSDIAGGSDPVDGSTGGGSSATIGNGSEDVHAILDSNRNLILTDTAGGRLRLVVASTKYKRVISLVGGDSGKPKTSSRSGWAQPCAVAAAATSGPEDGDFKSAAFMRPSGICIDPTGDSGDVLFVAEPHQLRRITTDGTFPPIATLIHAIGSAKDKDSHAAAANGTTATPAAPKAGAASAATATPAAATAANGAAAPKSSDKPADGDDDDAAPAAAAKKDGDAAAAGGTADKESCRACQCSIM